MVRRMRNKMVYVEFVLGFVGVEMVREMRKKMMV